MKRKAGLLAVLSVGASASDAQTPAARVAISFGIDTTVADVGEIVGLVRAYLARPDTTAPARGLWSTRDSVDRRHGDVVRHLAYQGFPASIVGVMSEGSGDSVYVVKVLHAKVDSATHTAKPLALQRLYAIRAFGTPHGWQLSNALPRLTRAWPTRRVGRVTFHYAPGQAPDPARAARAARFVDSVASLFDVPPPDHLDYYVTASPDEYFRALGLDFFPLPSGRDTNRGGNAIPYARIVLAGDPAQGEAYVHEIAHVVVGRVGGAPLLGEGIAVWFGGSKGRPAREMYHRLVAFQRSRPDVTIESVVKEELGWGPTEQDVVYATGALLVEAVHRRAGAAGVRALRDMPNEPSALLAAMRARLGLPAADAHALDRWWRDFARTAAEGR